MRLQRNPLSWLLCVVILAMVLVACEDTPTEEPPEIPPSITLKPPFISQTPQFTATLTPSQTFTPSETPPPSDTPTPNTPTITPSPSPTPGLQGSIFSASNVNLRSGPGNEFEVVVTAAPEQEVEILGAIRNDRREVWYWILFYNEDDEAVMGWVSERLIDDAGQIIPTLAPTPEVSPTPSNTPEPFATPTPDGSSTPVAISTDTPLSSLSDVNIRANCRELRETPLRPTTDQTVSLWWWWWVFRPELMEQHLEHVEYEILLDGRIIENWNDYRTDLYQEPRNGNRWTVAWYIPVGKLTAGEHTVTYRVTWREKVNDGGEDFGPGTTNSEITSSCTFTVVE